MRRREQPHSAKCLGNMIGCCRNSDECFRVVTWVTQVETQAVYMAIHNVICRSMVDWSKVVAAAIACYILMMLVIVLAPTLLMCHAADQGVACLQKSSFAIFATLLSTGVALSSFSAVTAGVFFSQHRRYVAAVSLGLILIGLHAVPMSMEIYDYFRLNRMVSMPGYIEQRLPLLVSLLIAAGVGCGLAIVREHRRQKQTRVE